MYRFNTTGNILDTMTIDNGSGGTVSGTVCLTSDGTNVYLANNSNVIYEVDPMTLTVTDSLTSAAGDALYIGYDSMANSGAGGFWVGNWSANRDLSLISRTGTVLSTISASTHNLGAPLGLATDYFSTGGPYLWAFSQEGTPSDAAIVQLSLPSGTPTGISFDVTSIIGASDDLAGGLFISDEIVNGEVTIGGLSQGTPDRVFGLELDFSPIQIDAAFTASGHLPTLGQIPLRFNSAFTFGGSIQNFGQQTINTLDADLSVNYSGTQVFSDNQSMMNVANLGVFNFSFSPYTPTAEGAYIATMTTNTGVQVDEIPSNNTVTIPFSMTDSVIARDNGVHDGGTGYAVSNDDAGIALTLFEFPVPVYLKGVEIEIATPNAGDMTNAVVVFVNANQPSGAPLLSSNPVTINANQNTYYLPFTAELPISAGSIWGIGVTEGANTRINLSQSESYFSQGVNFFSTDNGTSWNPSNLPTARFIRPILVPCADFSLDFNVENYNPDFNGEGTAEVIVNNSRGSLTIQWDDPANSTSEMITNLQPGTYNVTVTDENSCTATGSVDILDATSIEDDLAAGINNFKIYPNPTNGVISLDIEMAKISDLTLELVDLNGRTIFTESHQKVNVFNKSFDLSSISKGVYVLQATTSQGRTFKRVILE